MRFRSLAAGATLALLTAAWTASVAFAEPADATAPEPGGTLVAPTASQAPPSPAVRTFRRPDGQDGRDGQRGDGRRLRAPRSSAVSAPATSRPAPPAGPSTTTRTRQEGRR